MGEFNSDLPSRSSKIPKARIAVVAAVLGIGAMFVLTVLAHDRSMPESSGAVPSASMGPTPSQITILGARLCGIAKSNSDTATFIQALPPGTNPPSSQPAVNRTVSMVPYGVVQIACPGEFQRLHFQFLLDELITGKGDANHTGACDPYSQRELTYEQSVADWDCNGDGIYDYGPHARPSSKI